MALRRRYASLTKSPRPLRGKLQAFLYFSRKKRREGDDSDDVVSPDVPYDLFWPGLGAMTGIDWPGESTPIDWPGI